MTQSRYPIDAAASLVTSAAAAKPMAAEKPPTAAKPRLVEIIKGVKRELAELTGYPVDSVSALGKTDGGWRLAVSVIELSRVPTASDVLAEYEVDLDETGSVVNYSRRRRFFRNQVGDEGPE